MNMNGDELREAIKKAAEEADRQASIALWKLLARMGITASGLSIGFGWAFVENDWYGIPMIVIGLAVGIVCVRYLQKHLNSS